MIGRTLSHYEILEPLGSGGMGDVYLARDTKLDRKVALKVLPPELSESEERRARFQREAKAIAALNHPNIVHVYSVEEADGIHFITMELVKGKTLTELLPRDGFPLRRFFDIAIPLADAVAAAHQEGIAHRDLKPDNLMLTDEHRLKVLDFGLAKPVQGFTASSGIMTAAKTKEGAIVGTVAYMSPEQAEGKQVDHRSDLFSIGVILYEMLTGRKPFSGDSAASTLSSILKDQPTSVTELKTSVPRELGRIVRHSLAKDIERRYQSAKELRNELEELRQDLASGEILEGVPSIGRGGRHPGRARGVAFIAGWVVLSIVGAYWILRGRDGGDRVDVPALSGFTQITSDPGPESWPNLSPDGRSVVYSHDGDIYLKRVEGETTFNLTAQSPGLDTEPAFSPDGERIAFRSEREGGGLFVMGATGESVRRLTDFGFTPSWSPDATTIYFATEGFATLYGRFGSRARLWSVAVATGKTTELTSEGDAVEPRPSPHGERIAYWGLQGGQRDLWTIPVTGAPPVAVTQDAAVDGHPVWSPDGRYLYFSSDRGGSMNLWRVRIDESSGRVLAEPQPMTTPSPYAISLSFSRDGRRATYESALSTQNLQRVAFDPEAGTVSGDSVAITQGTHHWGKSALSSDGEWIAFTSTGDQEDLFILRTDGTGQRQLTDDRYRVRGPVWSHDGERIYFYSDRSGSYEIWSIRTDGSGLEPITDAPGDDLGYPVLSPDGSRMVVFRFRDGTSMILDLTVPWEEQTPVPLARWAGEGSASPWSWSSDGEKLAGFFSRGGIFVYSFADETYQRVADDGGAVTWLGDSRRLVFVSPLRLDGTKLYVLDTETGETRELLASPLGAPHYPFVSPDGRTLFFILRSVQADVWLAELATGQ